MKLSELKERFNLKIKKDGEFETLGIASRPHRNMLVFIENQKYIRLIDNPSVSCVICTENIINDIPERFAVATSEMPRKTFYEIHNELVKKGFYGQLKERFISEKARIHETASIPKENIYIGDGTIIDPNVVIFPNTWIGNNVRIRAGSVIGSNGFVFQKFGDDVLPVEHGGGVRIENDVEIQANCCVAKSLFKEYTTIGEKTKFDNLVHIAHDVKIGKRCLIAANATIAGAVILGDDVWIGPSAVISSELSIGDKASVTIGSVVVNDIQSERKVTGNFAIDHNKFLEFLIKNELV